MKIIRALRTVNYRLWFAIFTTMLLPTVYQTVRIFFLGDMPSDSGINIASQLQWVNLFYEVVQEALILPLFFLLGKSIDNRDEFANKVRTGLIVTAIIYAMVSVIVMLCARPLVVLMAQDTALSDATVTYVRLETVAALFSTLWRFMMTVLVTLKKDKYIYIVLIIQMVLSVLLDTFLISNLAVSAKLGVNGIAVTNIIVNAVILGCSILLLYRENIRLFAKQKRSFGWLNEWFKVGKFSGLESLLRNLAFMVMVVRMVNIVAEQGNYWLANNFIWQWLLLPGLALADLVKKEIGESKDNIRDKTFGYLVLVSIFAIIWLISIPLWKPFLQYVMNVEEYETVFKIVLLETGFYITFLFNSCIFDSTFYGIGKTNYMLIQSMCIDGFYYGVMFVLYLTGVFVPTLLGICLMFGIGMALDFIPTLCLYLRMLKKEKIKIDFQLEPKRNEI
ncbi:MAG: multidrug transporter [Oscillospiraceae bacterium]|jgi:putative Na+-driven multidrug efflux pump|nr:MAG: multidrug transporter [Oscillospiraceae bacterium]